MDVLRRLRFLPFALLAFAMAYGLLYEDLSVLLRYDKYELHPSWWRIGVIVALLAYAYLCNRYVAGAVWGTLLPANLFNIMFVVLVLPGALLTPDFSDTGEASFTAYALSYFLFLTGSVLFAALAGAPRARPAGARRYATRSPMFLCFAGLFAFGMLLALNSGVLSARALSSILSYAREGEVSRDVAEQRQVGGAFGYLSVAVNYIVLMIMPLSASFIFLNGLISRNRLHTAAGLVMSAVCVVLLAAQGGRLAALFVLLYFVVGYSMVWRITASQMFSLASLAALFLVVQTIALGRLATASEGQSVVGVVLLSLNRVIERVFLVKGYVTQHVFSFFPDQADFLGGSSYMIGLLGQRTDQPLLAQEMFDYVFGGGLDGTAGPQAFGEAYANFGFSGMYIFAFLLGIAVAAATRFVARRIRPDAFSIVFLAYATVLVARIGYGDFLTFKSNGMHILILVFICLYIFRQAAGAGHPAAGQAAARPAA